jgi:hypothetical protein
MDTYDQRVYAIGKGPSATTVSASEATQPVNTFVLIQGTVMDVSPGTEDIKLTMRFPNGVPVISDADMSDWMLYVYKQFEIPKEATGVTVVLNAIDESGTWHDVDRVKTDLKGSFSYRWIPETPGKYIIVATFEGSGGYFGSYAETAISVGPADAGYQGPSASEIAHETVSQMPAYPVSPTADEIAQATVSQMPDIQVPSASDVAQETVNQIPAYSTIDLVVIVLVVIAIIIGLYGIIKKK